MNGAKDIHSYGYKVGSIPCGKANLITDVPGVKVGHCTVEENGHKTGVTAVIPCDGNVFVKKPVASVFTLNGYGKTAGTIQIEELGVIETPICLTNTLNVGKVSDALVEYTIQKCAGDHIKVRSINPVVGETNDSLINPIQERVVEVHHVIQALESASEAFEQGCVGAGRGTVCCGLKGGIGSSSRVLDFAGKTYTLGALVQSNFGRMEDLMICGQPVGNRIAQELHPKNSKDEGSIMIIIGTDIPLSARQLKRVLKRAAVGLVRTGSYMGHGSGDVFIGFTNENYLPAAGKEKLLSISCFPEDRLDLVFRMAAESVEEAICNSLIYAHQETGVDGKIYHCLSEFLPERV